MTEEALFHEALAKPVTDRSAFLDQASAGQPALRAAVEALLAAHEASGDLLDLPAAAAPLVTGEYTPEPDAALPRPVKTTDYHPNAEPGVVIAGRYTLQEKLGEGGMGEVWVAKQTEPVKRRVALKLIKAGMDTKAVLQRFEAERQALALMDHPNIARVLDGGMTADRRPYFVMELVNGLPLTRFCDEAKLGIRERLELFAAICQAVQHAHQKGIIHRDLKPSNILVTLIDARPVPKVIDFGVAKAIGGKLLDESLSTQFGAVVGTLEYMSPEQAGFSGSDIDTRADIYSLGVLLYELLTGLRPIDAKRLRKAALTEMIRIIQEEEPSKPSTRLSTNESLPSLAALRQTEPKKLMALLRGELDWVVMKCLEKLRERRYETANDLVRDIQRYLADEVVEARPPSSGYRLKKFVKRNKGPVLAASLVFLALVAGVIGTTWGLIRAANARQGEEQQRLAAEAAAECATKAQERAEQGFAKAKDAVEHYLTAVTDDPDLKYKHDLHGLRKRLLEAAVPYYQWFAEQKPGEAALEAERGRAYLRLALVHDEMGEKDIARQEFERMQAIFAQLSADFPGVPTHRGNLATSYNNLGNLLRELGQAPAAEQALRRALDVYEKLMADFPNEPAHRQNLATSSNNLGNLLAAVGQRPAAEQAYRRALAIQEKLAADFPTESMYRRELAKTHNNVGVLLKGLGQKVAAEQAYRRALAIREGLAADFPTVPAHREDLARTHDNLGNLLKLMGDQPAAEQAYHRALEIQERLAADFPSVPAYRQELARTNNNLANLFTALGQHRKAEQAFRATADIQKKLAADFPTVSAYRMDLANSYKNFGELVFRGQGQAEASLAWFDKSIDLLEPLVRQETRLFTGRRFLRTAHWNRAEALDRLTRHADAVKDWNPALALNAVPEDETSIRSGRAASLARAGEHAQAVAEANELAQTKDATGGLLYDLACVCSIASAKTTGDPRPGSGDDYAARAVELLHQAFAKGYKDRDHLKTDDVLKALRDREDFKKLLAELEQKLPSHGKKQP